MRSPPIPFLWFNNNAEEAIKFYVELFPDSKITTTRRWGAAAPPGTDKEMLMTASLEINRQKLMVLNGGPHYQLTPAFSLMVLCKDQQEIDKYWYALTANGGAESRCGWLVDRFGLSWQIIPENLDALLSHPDSQRAQAAVRNMMGMGRIVVDEL